MLVAIPHNRNLLKVVLAAAFTTAISAVWLACAIHGYIAAQKMHQCPLPSPERLESKPTNSPSPKIVSPPPPSSTRRKNAPK